MSAVSPTPVSPSRGAVWLFSAPVDLAAFLGSAVVALRCTLEEFSQLSMRCRTFDAEDLAYDYLGILVLGQLGALIHGWTARASVPEAEDET